MSNLGGLVSGGLRPESNAVLLVPDAHNHSADLIAFSELLTDHAQNLRISKSKARDSAGREERQQEWQMNPDPFEKGVRAMQTVVALQCGASKYRRGPYR